MAKPMLAVDFGQKSWLGAILNEVGDIFSDIALFLPLAFVQPFQPAWVASVIALIVLSELAGIAGPLLGGTRRVDGALGRRAAACYSAPSASGLFASDHCPRAPVRCCQFPP
jgi:phosphatidylglycerophosphate synthase